MKKFLTLLLAAMALTCLFSCAGGENSSSQNASTSSGGAIELPEDEF